MRLFRTYEFLKMTINMMMTRCSFKFAQTRTTKIETFEVFALKEEYLIFLMGFVMPIFNCTFSSMIYLNVPIMADG